MSEIDLRDELSKMGTRITRLQEKVGNLHQRVERDHVRLKRFEPNAVEKMLDKNAEYIEQLRDHLQLMALKMSVLTELSFYARKFAPDTLAPVQSACVAAFDLEDEWWQSRKNLVIGDWLKELANTHGGIQP